MDTVDRNMEIIQRIRQTIQKTQESPHNVGEVFKRIDNLRRHTANITNRPFASKVTPKKLLNLSGRQDDSSIKKKDNQSEKKIQVHVTSFSLTSTIIQRDNVKERFFNIKCLGKGKTGDVFIAQDKFTNQLVAVKHIQKSTVNNYGLLDLLIQEIKIQYSLNHQNTVKLFGVLQDERKIVMVQELCEGNLLRATNISYETYIGYLYQIACGLDHMHSMNIIHRDIKPENILVTYDQAKIGDFGLAHHQKGLFEEQCRIQGLCGTVGYMAPEVQQDLSYGLKADAYSLGVIAYELYTGQLPGNPTIESELPKQVQDIYQKLTNPNENERWTVKQALQHHIFKPHLAKVVIDLPVVNMICYRTDKLIRQ